MRTPLFAAEEQDSLSKRLREVVPVSVGLGLAGVAPAIIEDAVATHRPFPRNSMLTGTPVAAAYPLLVTQMAEARRSGDPDRYDSYRYGALTVGGIGALADAGAILEAQKSNLLPPRQFRRAAGRRMLTNLGGLAAFAVLTHLMRPEEGPVEGVKPGLLPRWANPDPAPYVRGRVQIRQGDGSMRQPERMTAAEMILRRSQRGGIGAQL